MSILKTVDIGHALYMRKILGTSFVVSAFVCGAFFGVARAVADGELSADALVKLADDARFPRGSVVFQVKAEDLSKGKKVRETVYRVMTKGAGKTLVETIIPERQQGRKLLMLESDLWFFSPDIKRPTRVSLQQKLTGEISNGDIANTDYAGDYDAKIVAKETIEGKSAYHLHLTSKSKSATYAAIDYWIDAKTKSPLQANFLSVSGKVMKRGTYDRTAQVLGRERVTRFKVEDAYAKGKVSILTYSQHKQDKLDDSLFSKESMGQ